MADQLCIQEIMQRCNRCYLPRRRRIPAPGRTIASEVREPTEEDDRFQFNERFLQIIWNERELAPLTTTVDGRRLEIVSSGTWNHAAGPDFLDAVISLDGFTVRGDVEIHRDSADWFRHGHDEDPAYGRVVLHVVWSVGKIRPPLPTLVLGDHVPHPWREVFVELQAQEYPEARRVPPGTCAIRWAASDDDKIRSLLQVAGIARFEDKTLRAGASEDLGQALYESVFEALGYRSNRQSFRELARGVPLQRLRSLPSRLDREALLFGFAGLLPDPSLTLVVPELRPCLRDLWDRWWHLGSPRSGLQWRRAGSRPYNSPERRLAAGIECLESWLLRPEKSFFRTAERAGDSAILLDFMRERFAFQSPWQPFVNFERKLAKPARLLGDARVNDLLINVLLPFLNAHAGRRELPALRELAAASWLRVPRLQENRVLREAVHRFFVPPSRAKKLLKSAGLQQGVMELYRSFCQKLACDCKFCPFVTDMDSEPK